MDQIRLATELYDIRDTMKRFFKDKYPAQVAKYRPYIETSMRKNNLDAIPAMIRIVKRLQEIDGSAMQQALVMAAAVEIITGNYRLQKEESKRWNGNGMDQAGNPW